MEYELDRVTQINPQELRLIKIIALRIANKSIKSILDGIPKTDGENIWLPFSDNSMKFTDFIGLAAHESSHIRFKSVFDPELPSSILPQNPKLAMAILNIFEDSRIDFLLHKAYPGFWNELEKLNKKIILSISLNLHKYPPSVLETKDALNFVIILTSIAQYKCENLLFTKDFHNKQGYFKFASKNLGKFWNGVKECFKFVYDHLTFSSSIIASQMYIEHLQNLIKNSEINPLSSKKLIDSSDSEKDSSKTDHKNIKNYEIDDNLVSLNFPTIKPTKSEYRALKKMKNVLRTGKYNHEKLLAIMNNEFDYERSEIDNILEKIKFGKAESLKCDENNIEYFFESGFQIVLHTFDNIETLKVINNIKNPEEIYDNIVKKNQRLINELRNNFKKIRLKNDYHRGMRKGIINNRDLPRVVSSKGKFDRPFKLPVIKTHVKLMIIIDESGSMLGDFDFYDGDLYVDEDISQIIPIYTAKESAIILAESLRDTKISFGVVGFSAVADQMKIVEKIYKKFNAKISPEKLGAIWVSDSSSENRDGTSFKKIAQRHFTNIQEGVPIMIIISDGQPWHHGTDYVDLKAKSSTSKSINLLLNQGIRIFAISLDDRGEDYLKSIYSNNNYIIVSKPEEIKSKLVYLVKNIATHI